MLEWVVKKIDNMLKEAIAVRSFATERRKFIMTSKTAVTSKNVSMQNGRSCSIICKITIDTRR